MPYELQLSGRKASYLLTELRDALPSGFNACFDKAIPFGEGGYDHDSKIARIGTAGLHHTGIKSFSLQDDSVFVSSVVALFHEYGHYVDDADAGTAKEVIFSKVSTYGNPGYRLHGWKEFPHEVSAERMGVMMAYDALGAIFGSRGEDAVKRYVSCRVNDTAYVLQKDDIVTLDRDGLEAAFDNAMDRCVNRPRMPDDIRHYTSSDRLARFFKSVEGRRYFERFSDTVPGCVKDRMAAAANIHIDRANMDMRLSDADIDMDAAFGLKYGVNGRSPVTEKLFRMAEKENDMERDKIRDALDLQ